MGRMSYKDLEIYKLTHKLAVEVHKTTPECLPKYEMYEEGSQIRRSSKGISSAIVEGFGRKQYQQEFMRYVSFAIASCDETREHLDLLYESGSLADQTLYNDLFQRYAELGKMLYGFRQAIENNLKSHSLEPVP